jgi:AcrR family transcriptional regulator
MHKDNPQAAPPRHKPEMSVKERQALAARATLVEATVSCLDKFGYAATSINRIQEAASVSRGALTHHFPTKEDLMVATLDRLLISTLHPSLPSKDHGSAAGLAEDLQFIARSLSRSQNGRALAEVLLAMRTDPNLNERVAPRLKEWNAMIDGAILGYYKSASNDDQDVVLLWTITRSFLRGLVLQEPFTSDEATFTRMISRFSELVSPFLIKRKPRKQMP